MLFSMLVGPESYPFEDLVKLIAGVIGSRAIVMHLPVRLALLATGGIGKLLGDAVLTADEVAGLTANILSSDAPATGSTKLSDWLRQHKDTIGTSYFSEMKRRLHQRVAG